MKMGRFFRRKKPIIFDKGVLRKNDISLLILDERWNSLFKQSEKSSSFLKAEQALKDLLKEQARLETEKQEITQRKKKCMATILQLSDENYQKNHPSALEDMQKCQQEITVINDRLAEIEDEISKIPERIKKAKLDLLELTVNDVYDRLRTAQLKIKKLESEIELQKEKLKNMIAEKEGLSELVENAYSYFHDLLGGEEVEKFDKEFLA